MDKTKMYGLLHSDDGSAIIKQVRILKVSFGLPVGPDVHVWIDKSNKWVIERGVYDSAGKRQAQSITERYDTKEEARSAYSKARNETPKSKAPKKYPFFTFLRMNAQGLFVHDFDTIEQHGPIPTEIDIALNTEEPFESSYQWWTAAELKCSGNGKDAERRLSLASTPDEKKLAAEAEAAGLRVFPIIGGCYTGGCQYPRGDRPVCKAHSRLYFQLRKSPRIGGACTYDTTGIRSTQQIFSAIHQIREIADRISRERGTPCGINGVQLVMVLKPYKTSHNGQPSMQYGVSLESRAGSVAAISAQIIQQIDEYRMAGYLEAPPKQLPPADPDAEAPAMIAEFYGDFPPEEEGIIDGEFEEMTKPEPPMPRRASDTRQEETNPEPPPVVTHPPQPPPPFAPKPEPAPHLKELKRVLDLIGQDKFVQILGAHGILLEDFVKITPHTVEQMRGDFDLAIRARESVSSSATAGAPSGRPTFGDTSHKKR